MRAVTGRVDGEVVRIYGARGFGFVKTGVGDLLYFDAADVGGRGFGRLRAGIRVTFERDDALIPRATRIRRLASGDAHPAHHQR